MENLPPRVRGLVCEVARWYGLDPEDILGRSRKRDVVAARRDAVRVVRSLGRYRVKEIAFWFGDRRCNTLTVYRPTK